METKKGVIPMPHRPAPRKGHYCKVCGEYKANEKFSGKGHATHICKACASLPPEQRAEAIAVNRLISLPWRLSKADMTWLKNRAKDKRPAVRALAKEQLDARFPPARQARSERSVNMDIIAHEKEELEHLLRSLTEQTKRGTIRWECTEYNPISLLDETDLEDDQRRMVLSQMFTMEAEINGNSVCVELNEAIDLSAEKGDIAVTIMYDTDAGYNKFETALSYDVIHYDDYSAEQLNAAYGDSPVALFADAVMPTLAASPEVASAFSYARFVNQNGIPAKALKAPLSRLAEKLMQEKRVEDFHRIVLDMEYRRELLASIS